MDEKEIEKKVEKRKESDWGLIKALTVYMSVSFISIIVLDCIDLIQQRKIIESGNKLLSNLANKGVIRDMRDLNDLL